MSPLDLLLHAAWHLRPPASPGALGVGWTANRVVAGASPQFVVADVPGIVLR